MREITFHVENGRIDAHGDRIVLSGLKIPETVRITENFDPHKVIGKASLKKDELSVKATAEIDEDRMDLFPAIGFQVLSSEPNEFGGRTITGAVLHYVSLSPNPNLDPLIKTLSQQLNDEGAS